MSGLVGGARPPVPRVVIVSASIGGGHDGAAAELSRLLRDAGYAVDRHDFLDVIGPRAGRALRRTYATQLRVAPRSWGWFLDKMERHGPLADRAGQLCARAARARVPAVFGSDPVAVLSTYPLASQVLGRLRRSGALSAPAITFLTDLSVHRLWVAEGVDAHLALHPVTAAQAQRLGAHAVRVCAPAVDPAFHPATDPHEATRTRRRHGLPAGPLALVVAGSWGVGEVAEAASDIAASGLATPVTICGRNTGLKERLTRSGHGVALGWVDDVAALMRTSDVVVQNAGGLSALEAMATGVPVISYRCLPGHGTTNAAALAGAGLAAWVREPANLPSALRGALTGALRMRQHAAVTPVFRAPTALQAIEDLIGRPATDGRVATAGRHLVGAGQ